MLMTTAAALGALWLILVWLGRKGRNEQGGPTRVLMNRRKYDEARKQIEEAQRSGELNAEAAESEILRLQSALVHETESADDDTSEWASSISKPALLAILVLPLSIAVLAFLGTNGAMHWPGQSAGREMPPEIAQMVSRLETRLQENPNDARGWAMLARSYMVMQRFAEAADAWAEARAREPQPDPDLLVAEAEARGMAQGMSLEGRPRALLREALTIDSNHIRALWFMALAEQSAGNEDEAFAYLQKLAALPDLPSELVSTLQDIGISVAGHPGEPGAGAYALQVTVGLSEELAGKAPPGNILFVFAREANGPPMPVAVQRLQVAQWPVQVQLDDSSSMMPGREISSRNELEIVARISSGGGAKAQPGDWQGLAQWTNTPAGGRLQLDIDTVVP